MQIVIEGVSVVLPQYLNTDLKSLVKKPNKIPGFNNFTLNNSFNNLESVRMFSKSKSPKTASNKLFYR